MKHTNPDEARPAAEPTRGFPVLRLDPELRLCPQVDSGGVALFPVATRPCRQKSTPVLMHRGAFLCA